VPATRATHMVELHGFDRIASGLLLGVVTILGLVAGSAIGFASGHDTSDPHRPMASVGAMQPEDRQDALARLETRLGLAAAGTGRIAVVAGEASIPFT
jgi:hypothetical protein